MCDSVYYLLRYETLTQGLKKLQDDTHYILFLEFSCTTGDPLQVYIDQYNEHLFDWIRD